MLASLVLALLASAAPVPLTVQVGKAVAICATGTIQCPAGNPICDDTSVATAENSDAGLVFRGVAPGTTLCSAASGGGIGLRRVYRVTVTK